MSDTALKNARMSDALEQSLIREAIKAETLSGPFSRSGWRRSSCACAGSAAPSVKCCTTWTPAAASIL
ncbi:hypothetical protein WJ966_03855 [Achromobacter xylosoxidans]